MLYSRKIFCFKVERFRLMRVIRTSGVFAWVQNFVSFYFFFVCTEQSTAAVATAGRECGYCSCLGCGSFECIFLRRSGLNWMVCECIAVRPHNVSLLFFVDTERGKRTLTWHDERFPSLWRIGEVFPFRFGTWKDELGYELG